MDTLVKEDAQSALVDAEVILRDWPRSYGCKAALLGKTRALIATNLARDLPDCFSLAIAPDFNPRPCTVTWRGRDILKVMIFE